ncbi:MAG: ATP-binding protein [Niabella sp.]
MFGRDIYSTLETHLVKRQVTVITGMRRVGKSTAVKHLFTKAPQKTKLYLDCERIEVRTLLNRSNYEEIKEELELLGIVFDKPSLIALDEIQLVENLPSLIKYLYDTYGVKFIVTGSSSYYMKNTFSESLAGRKKIFELYPLSFKEFLVFKKQWASAFARYQWQPFKAPWYKRVNGLYKEYIDYGGFPEVVLQKRVSDKKDLLHDIINSYIELDVKLLSDYAAGEELYKLVKLLAARSGNKTDYSKISNISGLNRQKVASYIQLLEQTYLVYQLSPFTKNIDREISQQKKLYFSDTGILNVLAGNQLSSGQVFENAVAAQLKSLGDLQYYQKKTGQEIDFIFNGETAIEAKETPATHDLGTLSQRAAALQIKKRLLVGCHQPPVTFDEFIWAGAIW